MRCLGIDLGTRRIGLAISDPAGRLATPLQVLERSGDQARDHRRLADIVAEWEVDQVVVGMPFSLDGSVGPAAVKIQREVDVLGCHLVVPIATYDERLTTVQAHQVLAEQAMPERERRKVVDMVAATVLLQAWLDRHREANQDEE